MPRKAKEKIEEFEKSEEKKKSSTTTKKSSAKKETVAKKTTKKASTKTETATKKTTKKASDKTETAAKKTTKKASDKAETATKKTTKKASDKTETATKKSTKKTSTKTEATAKKTNSKSTGTRKKAIKKVENKEAPTQIVEYYDLPYKYGNTVVRLLAQTPKTLFVYWEVSENDIANFKNQYGEDFFNKTKPVLIVHNLTLNKTYEIEINDFANCWYLNTEDSDCKFDIELARKFVNTSSENIEDNYLFIAKSNTLQSPNNHILFEKIQEFVIFRNASNDNIIKKNIKSFKFLKDLYKFYKDMYDEDILNNPSSQF